MLESPHRTPGQLIQELLDKRGWSKRILAIILGIDETGLNKIIAGKRPLDAPLALLLSEVFHVDADHLLELQKQYDLAQAKITSRPDPKRESRAILFGDLPVSEMIKRGWLDVGTVRDVPGVERELAKFFGVAAASEIEILPHAAKKTNVNGPITPAQLAWLYRVREIASEMMVGRFSQQSCAAAIEQLKPLRIDPMAARKVPRILMECGIRFVIVESLASAKIDGVCFWLKETSPVIGMSIRHDRIDNFWFVIRHELEHVKQGHGQIEAMLDAELEGERAGVSGDIADEEVVANRAAADFCVPASKLESFIARKAPFFAERDIVGLANTLGVHPGLVAGQLQNKTGRYDRFRDHLVKIRDCVRPGATVDGWGDVAPVGV